VGDRLTGSAGELLAHVGDHLPLPRNEFQRLGDILADLAQSAVTAAGADGRRRIDDALARQMPRQPAARRPPPLERRLGDLRRPDILDAVSRLRLTNFIRRVILYMMHVSGDAQMPLLLCREPQALL
jgi:hypothetical protein